MKAVSNKKTLLFLLIFLNLFLASLMSIAQSSIIAFQGNEGTASDNWGFTTSGASAAVLGYSGLAGNKITGSSSIAVGGNNSSGGDCITGCCSGNGPNKPHSIVFNDLDVSTTNTISRILSFSYGNYQPSCSGTGWDTGENLVFTPYHDLVEQASTTLVTGAGNLSINIATNSFSYTIPAGVNSFSFKLAITTNRNDEYLFVDDVKITIPVPQSTAFFIIKRKEKNGDLLFAWKNNGVNSMLTLEKSLNGIDFKPLADLNGISNEYYFAKESSDKGLYFRLKSVDQNGFVSYSNIIQDSGVELSSSPLFIYPNPTNDYLTIDSPFEKLEKENISVQDLSGRVFENGFDGNRIDMTVFSSGTYILLVKSDSGNQYFKIVKE